MFNKYKVSTGHQKKKKRFKYTSWASLVAQVVKNAGDAGSVPGSRRPLEKGMATHSKESDRTESQTHTTRQSNH